jgi:hypothetical protein
MGGRRRLLRPGLLPVCAVLLLAGCASMPSSGEVSKVGDGQRADAGDSVVRVFGVPPHAGENASGIVDGFLEATTSGEPDFATAKKYLTHDAALHWHPSAKITVYSGNLTPWLVTDPKNDYSRVTLSGSQAASVDTKHAYQPEQGPFAAAFHLIRQDNEWRIDTLPDGLVLSASNFHRIYHSANMYYFARLGPEAGVDGRAQQTLVADPVYLRNQTDPLVATVSALLGGPTDWLAPVVSSVAPAGARLDDKAPDHGVTLDDSQHLTVRLDHSADKLGGQHCVQLAAQVFFTVQAQASSKLASAQVDHADGSRACSLPSSQAAHLAPGNLIGSTTSQYYISADSQHRLVELDGRGTTARAVTGPFGSAKAGLDAVAVRRDASMAAGLRNNGHDLVVGSLFDTKPFAAPVLTSTGADAQDALSAPSWDGFGDLWVADRNPADPRLMVLRGGGGTPEPVAMPKLDGRVESLRVASDGVRIALVVEEHKALRLQIGRIERTGDLAHPSFSVTGLRTLTPAGESIASVSWAGASRLVVLASETGGVQQIEYLNTDGSAGSALQGVSEATSVAASEDPSKPLLASYNGSVYLLPADANWKRVTPQGSSPVYPG